MGAKAKPKPSPQVDKLMYFLALRQMETKSPAIHEAYERLADAASQAAGWDLKTVILDWLEAELRTLQALKDAGANPSELTRAAVALGNALRQ